MQLLYRNNLSAICSNNSTMFKTRQKQHFVLLFTFKRHVVFLQNVVDGGVELEMLVNKSAGFPRGPVTLLSKHAKLQTQWETAAGNDSTYPGHHLYQPFQVPLTTSGIIHTYTHAYAHNDQQCLFKMNLKVASVHWETVSVVLACVNCCRLCGRVLAELHHLGELHQYNLQWDWSNKRPEPPDEFKSGYCPR